MHAYEYFCFGCGECRVSFVDIDGTSEALCAGCGSPELVQTRNLGALDLPYLRWLRLTLRLALRLRRRLAL
jgi:DNA-directed RNA polymerase subunit RPC12/RpoP